MTGRVESTLGSDRGLWSGLPPQTPDCTAGWAESSSQASIVLLVVVHEYAHIDRCPELKLGKERKSGRASISSPT